MRLRLLPAVVCTALLAGSCSAAIPTARGLATSGAVRLSAADGVVVRAGASGVPVFVTRRNELCVGDLLDRVATADDVELVDSVPVAELSLDCIDFSGGVIFPRWSPDSTQIAFMGTSASAESDIWVYDPVAGAATNLSADAGDDTMPLWIDEGRLVFVRTTRGTEGVETSWFQVEADGGLPVLVASVDGAVELGSGRTIVTGESVGGIMFNAVDDSGDPAGLKRLDLASGAIETVFVFDEPDAEDGVELVDVHPDGMQALMLLGGGTAGVESGVGRLVLVDLTTSTYRELAPIFGSRIAGARFSSDGLLILMRELMTERGDALVARSTASDEDAEVLLYGEIGSIGIFGGGVTVDLGAELVVIRLPS